MLASPAAVVAHFNTDSLGAVLRTNRDMLRLRVFDHVGQRFLHDSEDGRRIIKIRLAFGSKERFGPGDAVTA
jgi:hypothetical protein